MAKHISARFCKTVPPRKEISQTRTTDKPMVEKVEDYIEEMNESIDRSPSQEDRKRATSIDERAVYDCPINRSSKTVGRNNDW